MKQYTWYVNLIGQVQIYEGDFHESLIKDAYSLDDAMEDQSIKHEHRKPVHKKRYKGLRGLFSNEYNTTWEVDKVTYEERPQIKYWFPEEYTEAFFTCIGEIKAVTGESGVTTVNISEFLD
ncbi:hypothetical protein [Peribacillus glennii]|uniref:Uncharacterized protein n=1 Tax=Peribacillus glennii TaxID=2303991 RepID=A0A372L931_9BACI|nr:hypothetical protein [Peribacillus glennii]RFU61641.1 hypothetical protein D0466_17755 [Peribacillus glennii]